MPKRTNTITILLIALSACSAGLADRTHLQARQQEAARITTVCGLPQGTMTVTEEGELRIQPRPTESYQKVDCALAELRKSGVLRGALKGFVGNEQYENSQ